MVKVEVKGFAVVTITKIVMISLKMAVFLVWLMNWIDAMVRPELSKEVFTTRALLVRLLFKEVCDVVARFRLVTIRQRTSMGSKLSRSLSSNQTSEYSGL